VSAAGLATRLENLTDLVPFDSVVKAGRVLDDEATAEAARTIGGSGRLRGVALHGNMTGVKTTSGGASAEFYGSPKGLWMWIEKAGTPRPHKILNAGKRAMPISIGRADAPYASGSVQHPGVTAAGWSGAWSRVIRYGERQIPDIVLSEIREKVTY